MNAWHVRNNGSLLFPGPCIRRSVLQGRRLHTSVPCVGGPCRGHTCETLHSCVKQSPPTHFLPKLGSVSICLQETSSSSLRAHALRETAGVRGCVITFASSPTARALTAARVSTRRANTRTAASMQQRRGAQAPAKASSSVQGRLHLNTNRFYKQM
jgi:hypothetical protein